MTTETPVYEPDTSLVAALWRFIENSGTTEEFFELRQRVRQHATLPHADRAVSRRTVEITDEDENIVVAFVPVDPKTPCNR